MRLISADEAMERCASAMERDSRDALSCGPDWHANVRAIYQAAALLVNVRTHGLDDRLVVPEWLMEFSSADERKASDDADDASAVTSGDDADGRADQAASGSQSAAESGGAPSAPDDATRRVWRCTKHGDTVEPETGRCRVRSRHPDHPECPHPLYVPCEGEPDVREAYRDLLAEVDAELCRSEVPGTVGGTELTRAMRVRWLADSRADTLKDLSAVRAEVELLRRDRDQEAKRVELLAHVPDLLRDSPQWLIRALRKTRRVRAWPPTDDEARAIFAGLARALERGDESS